ncbi:barstar family protein [Gandjariella thermophila]|uniref:Barstar (barnase inhibitor) domain-containing protein n=1 Tax=Gandjariella thermophila TaxID=1931992 RepID=A0A4D4JGM9_9PSEU|nr:hypothetical protein [Gandjariella thermophila]GDY33053.1 hypothetical protein GTS_46860 [Gandjariella thermophila]
MSYPATLSSIFEDEIVAAHVGVGRALAQHVLEVARASGYDCHQLHLVDVHTPAEYYALLGREFQFPTPVVNDHGAIDWMSDLEWLGQYPGHVVVVDGLADLRSHNPNIFGALVYMFPHVLDRMRSGDERYHVFFVESDPLLVKSIIDELEQANAILSADSEVGSCINPSNPVPIVDHRRGRRSNAHA